MSISLFFDSSARTFRSHPLQPQDIPLLRQLEARQWNTEQASTEDVPRARTLAHPTLCVGTFCAKTGQALTPLFLRPVEREKNAANSQLDQLRWRCHQRHGEFISQPASPAAEAALETNMWPLALGRGWREIYLGFPMPGLHAALRQDPGLSAYAYVHATRRHLPSDPHLRHCHPKGLRGIGAVLPGYFPHSDALDHGVLLRCYMQDTADCAHVAASSGALELQLDAVKTDEAARMSEALLTPLNPNLPALQAGRGKPKQDARSHHTGVAALLQCGHWSSECNRGS